MNRSPSRRPTSFQSKSSGLPSKKGPSSWLMIGAEEAVGAVRGRHRAHAAQRRHVRPVRVTLARVLVAPDERRRPLEVGRGQRDGDELEDQVVGVRRRDVVLRLPVVVEERDVLARAALHPCAAQPVQAGHVAAVAAVVDQEDGVPQHLVAGVGVVLADVGEGLAGDVVGTLAGVLVHRLLLGREHEVLAVPLGRLGVAVVPLVALVGVVDHLVRVFALLVVLVDLGRQEVAGLVGGRLIDGHARRDLGPEARREREACEQREC